MCKLTLVNGPARDQEQAHAVLWHGTGITGPAVAGMPDLFLRPCLAQGTCASTLQCENSYKRTTFHRAHKGLTNNTYMSHTQGTSVFFFLSTEDMCTCTFVYNIIHPHTMCILTYF